MPLLSAVAVNGILFQPLWPSPVVDQQTFQRRASLTRSQNQPSLDLHHFYFFHRRLSVTPCSLSLRGCVVVVGGKLHISVCF